MRKWRFLQVERRSFGVYTELELNRHDAWIGVAWKFYRFAGKIEGSDRRWGSFSDRPWVFEANVCLLPCVLLRVNVDRVVRP